MSFQISWDVSIKGKEMNLLPWALTACPLHVSPAAQSSTAGTEPPCAVAGAGWMQGWASPTHQVSAYLLFRGTEMMRFFISCLL